MSRTGDYYQNKKEEIEGVIDQEMTEIQIDEAPELQERNIIFKR